MQRSVIERHFLKAETLCSHTEILQSTTRKHLPYVTRPKCHYVIRPDMTEKLLTGTLSLNTNKQKPLCNIAFHWLTSVFVAVGAYLWWNIKRFKRKHMRKSALEWGKLY